MTGLLFADEPFTTMAELMSAHPSRLEVAPTAARVTEALRGCQDGELFLEYSHQDRLTFSEGKVKSAAFRSSRGMGLRATVEGRSYFGYSSNLDPAGLETLIDHLALADEHHSFATPGDPHAASSVFYTSDDPLLSADFQARVAFLSDLDRIARRHPLVQDVTLTLIGNWQVIAGLRPQHPLYHDIRPRAELGIAVVMKRGETRASGSESVGGREGFARLLAEGSPALERALQQAETMLDAEDGQAGEMDVVLGAGWPGILLHEAVGHGLEADFNRKGTSVFTALMGKQVASKGVTVVDNGTLAGRRGSLHCDDEGTPTQSTTLIEDGILVGYLHDRLNAAMMGTSSTGNGRRQSAAHLPMPRMTNTYMLDGSDTEDDLIGAIDDGLYAVSFGGGSVDITSGQFVFNCTEAYRIANGKVSHPIRGASLIGLGSKALKGICGIANNSRLDPGMGTCGKNGQWVPVGVGQPALSIKGLKVGGARQHG